MILASQTPSLYLLILKLNWEFIFALYLNVTDFPCELSFCKTTVTGLPPHSPPTLLWSAQWLTATVINNLTDVKILLIAHLERRTEATCVCAPGLWSFKKKNVIRQVLFMSQTIRQVLFMSQTIRQVLLMSWLFSDYFLACNQSLRFVCNVL